MNRRQTTDDKIMKAFESLVERQGFSATTTSQLAREAGVNESTIFRHFGDKLGLAKELLQRYQHDFQQIMPARGLTGELEEDLIYFAKLYRKQWPHQYIMVMLMLASTTKNEEQPEIRQVMYQILEKMLPKIKDYFVEMQQLQKIRADVDPEQVAANFIWLNLGQFWTSRFIKQNHSAELDQQFIDWSIRPFARLLKNQDEPLKD